MLEMRAKFFGRVQGVGMRAHVRSLALELKLKGTVSNSPDGSVEVVAQGPRSKLEELISKIKMRFLIERVTLDFKDVHRSLEGFIVL